MKTQAMEHQAVGRHLLSVNPDHYLLACEQGTGKTWMLLADAEDQWLANQIDALLVIAPKGVHTNWVLREIPAHVEVPVRAAYYSSGASRKRKLEVEKLFRPVPYDSPILTVLTINIDAINFKEGYALAARFLKQYRCIAAIDESSRIKNPSAGRTKQAWKLGKLAVSKRIASGTPITQSPVDIFAQFEFLAPEKGLLGTTSYRAFVAEYAQLLPPDHHLMKHIATKSKFTPQVVATDAFGRKIWRNLDKLSSLLAPHMYRVLKKDCLDLPDKIYKTAYFELTPKQQKVYDQLRDELRYERDDGEIDTFTALTKIGKLQQVTSSFIIVDGVPVWVEEEVSPRINLLMEVIEDVDEEESIIIFARFREEIAQIARTLKKNGISFVEYHGGVKKDDREIAIDSFQAGTARVFIGNAQSAGIGLTLTRGTSVIYYSQTFAAEERWQSEDRAHRIGTTKNVVYTDLCAVGTVDEQISAALQNKKNTAAQILDRKSEEEGEAFDYFGYEAMMTKQILEGI